MNELAKTITFAVLAVVALGVLIISGWVSESWTPMLEPKEMIGKPLFAEFDPLDVTSLEIVKYDENTGEFHPFEVAQVKGIWSIPSNAEYPADAEDQLADAASSLMGREVLDVESDNPGDHGLYGVLDPDRKTLKPGAVGVGTRVTMKGTDEKGKDNQVLLAMIIGKEVKGQDGLRYVRRVGQNPVYTMAIKTDKLSTKFEDWIEKDLLKLSTWDIKRIEVRDHSVDEANMALIQSSEMTLEYDDAGETKWKLTKDNKFQSGQWVPVEMADDEELDTEKLNDLKFALDDLKIVDVRRKPDGLSDDLKAAEDFAKNEEAIGSLAECGFYVAKVGDRVELFSNEGEIRSLMKDGVEYVLRFGNITGGRAPSSTEGEEGDSGSDGLNRYIFVMAEFDPNNVPEPDYEELPKEEQQPSEEGTAEEKTEGAETEGTETEDQTPKEKTEGQTAEEETEGTETEDETPKEKTEGPAAEGETESTETEGETPKEKTEGQTVEEKSADKTPEEKSDDKALEEKTDDEPDLQKERERIEKENKRKEEEHLEKIAEGEKKRDELNARFADWYYIISDEVYQKIHLSRDQIVKKKEKEEEKDGDDTGADVDQPGHEHTEEPEDAASPVEEFNRLKQEGPGGSE